MSLGGPRARMSIQGPGGPIFLDATLSENHELQAEVPEHSVEEGTNVADHVRVKPRQLVIEGIVSHTPIEGAPDESLAAKTWGQFKQMQEHAELISVFTEIDQYSNMVVQSVTSTRNSENAEGLQFTITLRQIRVVSNKTAAVPTKKAAAKKKVDKGEQPAPPVTSFTYDALFGPSGLFPSTSP